MDNADNKPKVAAKPYVYTPAAKPSKPAFKKAHNGKPMAHKPLTPFWNIQNKLRQKPNTPEQTAMQQNGLVLIGTSPVKGSAALVEGVVAATGFTLRGKNPFLFVWDEHGNKLSLSSFMEVVEPTMTGVAIQFGRPSIKIQSDLRLNHNPVAVSALVRGANEALLKHKRGIGNDKFFISAPVISQNQKPFEVLHQTLFDLLSSLTPDLSKDEKKTFLSDADKKAVTAFGSDALLKAIHLNRPPVGVYEQLADERAAKAASVETAVATPVEAAPAAEASPAE